MKSPKSKKQKDNLIVYQCAFNLYVQDLQAQMYFPSSFQVVWKTKDNEILVSTQKFNIKNQQNQVRFDETLTGSVIMVYDTQTQTYIQKDTLIFVNYYLNNKQQQIKQLGKVTLRMSKFMDEKSESGLEKNISSKDKRNRMMMGRTTKESTRRISQHKYFKPSDSSTQQTKCMRLQNSQYNAKLRFKCLLIQCKQSQIPISQLKIQQFNDPIQFGHGLKKSLSISKQFSSSHSSRVNTQSKEDNEEKQLVHSKTSREMTEGTVNNNVMRLLKKKTSLKGFNRSQTQQNEQGEKTIRYDYNKKKQANISYPQEQKVSKQLQNSQKQQQQQIKKSNKQLLLIKQNDQLHTRIQQLHTRIQQLQKQNNNLKGLVQFKQQQIEQKSQQIDSLQNKIFELEQQLREKQVYYLGNLQKLQQVDQLRYELIQVKEYADKLQQRLVVKYKQNPQFLQSILRAIQGSKLESRRSTLKDIVFGYQKYQKSSTLNNNNNNGNLNLVSSITIIDEHNSPQKGLSTSVSGKQPNQIQQPLSSSILNIRQSRRNDTRRTIVQNLYNLSNSEIQLTNSQMRMIQGSTVKMVNELQFMQMQLYEVKAQVSFQQQKYETQCIHHQQTKMQLFQTQQLIKQTKKQLSLLQSQHLGLIQQMEKLQEQNNQLQQQISQLRWKQVDQKKEMFLLKQQKQQQQYQMNIVIRQQKIQLQTLQQRINAYNRQINTLNTVINTNNQRTVKIQSDTVSLKNQIITIRKQNTKLHLQIQQFRQKQIKVNQYLTNLQNQIQQVYKIVQEKEQSEDRFVEKIKEKESIISRLEQQLKTFQLVNNNLQLVVQNCYKQITLYQQTINGHKQQQQNSHKQQQQSHRITNQNDFINNNNNNNKNKLLFDNKQLIQKNKQLIEVLNKNANTIVLYQKQKKQLIVINTRLQQLKQVNKLYQQIKQLYDNLLVEKQRLSKQSQRLKQNFITNQQQHNNITHKFQQYLSQQLQKNIKLTQQLNTVNQKLSSIEFTLIQSTQSINQLQLKLSKSNKQKILLQQSLKLLQSKNKNYQSMLVKYQSTIQTNQSVIKQLSTKIKHIETYQLPGQHQLKTSSYGLYDSAGMSEIKLQSRIQDSTNRLQSINSNNNNNNSDNNNINNSSNNNNNSNNISDNNKNPIVLLLKQNSLPQTHTKQQNSIIVKNLQTQIQELKLKLQTYNSFGDISTLSQRKRYQQKTTILMQMMQQYLNTKRDSDKKSEFNQIIQKINKLRSHQQRSHQQTSHDELIIGILQLKQKAQQISKNITIYKNKVLRDNRSKTKSVIQSIIEPLKPIQNTIKQLIQLSESIDTSMKSVKILNNKKRAPNFV